MGIDDLGVRSWFNIGVRSDADNALAADDNTRSRRNANIAWIE